MENYYFVVSDIIENAINLPDIVHLMDDYKYEFFSSGVCSKMSKFKILDCYETGISTGIYKNNDGAYILLIQDYFPKGNMRIYDINGMWEKIKQPNGSIMWLKVIKQFEDDYKLYAKVGEIEYELASKEEILSLFK